MINVKGREFFLGRVIAGSVPRKCLRVINVKGREFFLTRVKAGSVPRKCLRVVNVKGLVCPCRLAALGRNDECLAFL